MSAHFNSTSNRRVTPKEAANYVPPLNEMIGNYELRDFLQDALQQLSPGDDANLLVIGPPGMGKTVTVISYLRQRLGNPDLGYEDDADFFTMLAGKQHGFMRINGSVIDAAELRVTVKYAMNNFCVHTHVVLDEGGELFFQGLEEVLRPMLDHPTVTTYATAQNFHQRKRRSDTEKEHEDRFKAFLRRFPIRIHTQAPVAEEMNGLIKARLQRWGMTADSEKTIELLVRKSYSSDGYVPGYALSCLIKAIARLKKVLTYEFVAEFTPNPEDE